MRSLAPAREDHRSLLPRCLPAVVTASLLSVAATTGAAAQSQPAPVLRSTPRGDVVANADVDRTAIWVADRVTYTIELTCARGMDVLADDLSRDKLKLDGLEVVLTDVSRQTLGNDEIRYRFRYDLTTYRVDLPILKVAPLVARYYVRRPGQRLEDAPPAGDVQVPGATVVFRSLLPEDLPSLAIRDKRVAVTRSALLSMMRPIGLGLILVSIVPAAALAIAMAGRGRRRVVRRSARRVRHDEQVSLEAVRSMDTSTPESRRALVDKLDGLVRHHLHELWGIGAPALTPAEIAPALASRGERVPSELVLSVLTACELARYQPLEGGPSAEACRDMLAQAEQVLSTGR